MSDADEERTTAPEDPPARPPVPPARPPVPPSLPPELQHAEDHPRDDHSRRRRRGLIIGLIALVVAIALIGYGLLPLFQQTETPEFPDVPVPAEPAANNFGAQHLEWVDCESGMQCARAWAPLDWADPEGERISLALIKQPATGGEPLGTLFVNPGGPGGSGVQYLSSGVGSAVSEAVQESYDVISWDPRGVGDSTPVTCFDAEGTDAYIFGDGGGLNDLETGSDEWIAAARVSAAEFADACKESTGPLLAHVATSDTVQDLNMLREIVGDERLNYLGYSYGTYIGAQYADRYPDLVGAVVLDGAMDPTAEHTDVVREQTRGFEDALRRYVVACLERSDCPFPALAGVRGAGEDSVTATMSWISDLIADLDHRELRADDGRVLYSGTMVTAIITPLYSAGSDELLDDLFTTVVEGDPSTAFRYADFYYDRGVNGEYTVNLIEAFSAINCLDYPSDDDPERMRERAQEIIDAAPSMGPFQGFGDIACAAWPYSDVTERTPVSAEGADPILVVGTTGDTATPYRWAVSLAEQLVSGVLLTYEGEGHTAYGQSDCVSDQVDAYLLTGKVPDEGARC